MKLEDSTSRVGIGTTNPSQKLDVNGNIIADKIYLTDSGTDSMDWQSGDGVFQFSGGLDVGGVLFANNISGGEWLAVGFLAGHGVTGSGNVFLGSRAGYDGGGQVTTVSNYWSLNIVSCIYSCTCPFTTTNIISKKNSPNIKPT